MEVKEKIKEISSIFGLGDEEKLKTELWYSPKKGLTLVKIYNPYTSKGLFMASNNRTKYVCFDCRFYKAQKIPENFEVFKSHILELPIYTAFQELKHLIKKHQIMQDIHLYVAIYRAGKYKFKIKRLNQNQFYKALNEKISFKSLPKYEEPINVEEEPVG